MIELTLAMAERAQKGAMFWAMVPAVLAGQVLPSHGGTPIVVKGKVIGGIGCGGGTGEQDQECSDAGARVLGESQP